MKNLDKEVITPYQEFFSLEKKMNMFSLKYKEVYYWQLVRFGLLKKITTKNLEVANSNTSRNYKKEILGACKEAARMRKILAQVQNVDIIRIRPCVTITNDGKLDDHQYDYIPLEDKYKILDLYALGDYGIVPECVKFDMAPAEEKIIFWKIKRKVLKINYRVDDKQHGILKKFLDNINRIYEVNFQIEELEKEIQYVVNCHIRYKNYYLKFFKQTTPKMIMVYPHYDEHMFAANAAAKEIGITIIEMQHGRINAHEAYWYEDDGIEGKLLPDYFFVYGEWWKEQIKLPKFSLPVVVGNPYLEKQLKLYPQTDNNDHKVLAVFSNPQNGKELSKFIYSMKDYFVENDIEILYKLHPNERKVWRKEYSYLLEMQNAQIIDDNTSVYKVLSCACAAVGINSTVFYEALAYHGIKLFIYMMGEYEAMKPLLENGMAKGIKNREELIYYISDMDSNDKTNGSNEIELWRKNASANIIQKMSELMK